MRDICDGTADIPASMRVKYLKRWGIEHNAEPTRKVHTGKLVQTRIDEQVVRERQDEPKPQREKPAPRPTLPPCVHLLEVIREEGCRLCGGRQVIAPIHGCGIHGECTQNNYGLRGNARFLATCITCIDYSEIGGLDGRTRLPTDPGADPRGVPQDPRDVDAKRVGTAGPTQAATAGDAGGEDAAGAHAMRQ